MLVIGGPANAKAPKRLKLGKEGSYAQTFANQSSLWQDDTGTTVFVRNHKVVAVWITSNYEFDDGGACWPIGNAGTLLPDQTTMGPVSVEVHPKSPVALNSKNVFTIKPSRGNPFYEGGGVITGKLLRSGKLSLTAKLSQAASSFQGRCSTHIQAPRAKFKAFKVSKEIG